MKRKILSILLALCMVICLMPQVAYAEGWTLYGGEWVWLNGDGDRATNTFKLSGSTYYWLNSEGYLGSNELVKYGDDYYYVDENGAMVKSQWVDVENKNNSQNDAFKDVKTLRYYFQSSGKAYKSGKKAIGGETYVFDSQSRMLYGWINYSNGIYSMASKDADSEAWKTCLYYAGDDGALVKKSWQQIRVYDGSSFCDYKFFFRANGKKNMMNDEDAATGYSVIKVDSVDYAFAADGHMLTEWDGQTSGESTSNSGWSWDAEAQKSYYLGDDGKALYKDQIQTINGKTYLFDSDGSILAGLYYLEFADDGATVSSKALLNGEETLDSYTTINGNKYDNSKSSSKSGVYYFEEPASVAGQMVTGSVSVKVDGDSYSFRFETSGSNKGKGFNGRYSNSYYVNGRKVKADSDQKYELFQRDTNSGNVTGLSGGGNTACQIATDESPTQYMPYALISSSGTIVKSGTKTDGSGYRIVVEDYRVTEIKNSSGQVVWPSSGLSTPAATLKFSDSESAETATFTYGTDASKIKPSVVFASGGSDSSAAVTYKYGTDIDTATDWPNTETKPSVGTYYAWAIIGATSNYAGATIATSFDITGENIDPTKVSAKNITKTYTGEEQEIKISVDTSEISGMTNGKVTYSLTREGVYSDSLIFRNATNGEQTVYYKITSDNYNEYIGTATVTVDPIVANLTWSDDANVNCTEAENIVVTVNNAKEGDDFNITYDRIIDSTGKLTVTVKSLGNSNYSLPTDAAVKQKVVSVTHTGTEKYVKVNDETHHKVYSCCNCETEAAENHTFDKEVVDIKFLKSAANCKSAAVYYKSCICGAFSTAEDAQTFTSGTADTSKHAGELGDWKSNDTKHWKVYPCCRGKAEEAAHSGGIATCTAKAVCSACNAEYGTKLSHTYDKEVADIKFLKAAATCKTPAVYYKSCVCGAFSTAEGAQTFESGTVDANNHAGEPGDWKSNSTQHWKEYSCCNTKVEIANHTDANSDNKCDVCSKVLVTYSGGGSSTTDNVTNRTETTAAGTEKVTNADISSKISVDADGSRTASVTVDAATAEKIVEKAVENKSETVIINGVSKEAAYPAAIEVAIPAATVTSLSEKTDAGIAIKTNDADITLDKQAVAAVADKVSGTDGDVKITVKKVGEDSSNLELDIKIETADGEIKNFNGGSMTVTVKLSDELAEKKLVCVNIDDKGIYHRVKGQKNADKTFTFNAL